MPGCLYVWCPPPNDNIQMLSCRLMWQNYFLQSVHCMGNKFLAIFLQYKHIEILYGGNDAWKLLQSILIFRAHFVRANLNSIVIMCCVLERTRTTQRIGSINQVTPLGCIRKNRAGVINALVIDCGGCCCWSILKWIWIMTSWRSHASHAYTSNGQHSFFIWHEWKRFFCVSHSFISVSLFHAFFFWLIFFSYFCHFYHVSLFCLIISLFRFGLPNDVIPCWFRSMCVACKRNRFTFYLCSSIVHLPRRFYVISISFERMDHVHVCHDIHHVSSEELYIWFVFFFFFKNKLEFVFSFIPVPSHLRVI